MKSEMDDDNNDQDFEVEEVVDMKLEDSKKVYLIKWQGYPSCENTWEPEENLACFELIKDFVMKSELQVADKKSIAVAGKKPPLKMPTPSTISFMDNILEEVKLQRITSVKMLLDEKVAILKVARCSTLTKGRRGKPLKQVVNEMRQRLCDPTSYEFSRLSDVFKVEPEKQAGYDENASAPALALLMPAAPKVETANTDSQPPVKHAKSQSSAKGCQNETATCYLISASQALMGLARFCREAERVRAGPLLDAWKVVMIEMRHGEPDEILQAMKYLRVRGGHDMNNMFIDHTSHHDSEEWVALFLATAKMQIAELQPNLRIVEPMTFIDRHFEYSLKNLINCSSCHSTLEVFEENVVLNLVVLGSGRCPSVQQLLRRCLREAGECERKSCSKKRQTTSTVKRFQRLPINLLLKIVRYNDRGEKLHTPVTFEEILEITEHLSDDCIVPLREGVKVTSSFERFWDEDPVMQHAFQQIWSQELMESRPKARCANYQLRSVVHHYNAHYTTYGVRNGRWWSFNDGEVSEKTFAEVKSDAARGCVMLVYDICEGPINAQQEQTGESKKQVP